MSGYPNYDLEDDDSGQVQWFGASWHAPICNDTKHVTTPIGDDCIFCQLEIAADDQGIMMLGGAGHRVPAHIACLLTNVGQGGMVLQNPYIKKQWQ